ncbi:2-oxoglutarate dehydrogenase E1 component [Roseateles sp. YR242]|uniref:2-oxoglutarate dehydrogenase E1 component n=1 Tax=Roseateles sp. YR242 TaxID=1855305 RepID=UPI0008B23677|nr:2-oxoglutarate dehydrogenase E1 component [Roseateles sp. YR242]SEL84870.1 2-oxoglutarate dehydrogenase E1 component [Roseateles sp. YR242]
MNDINRHVGIQAPQPSRLRPEVLAFIDAHRRLGDRCAHVDPLQLSRPADLAALDPRAFGLAPSDWLNAAGTPLWSARTVADLDSCLKAIYCGTLALDATAVRDDERREWLFQRMESAPPTPQGNQERLALLEHLIRAQTWEEHVALHFPHGKRFSLEGNETLIPLLHALCADAAAHGVERILMGMPHRGRVNVMINLLGLPPAQVLDFFDSKSPHPERHTDLVYHLGGERELSTPQGKVHLTLAHNPSHLQSVHPVLLGMARAQQDALGPDGARRVLPLMLHGDAAFAGQGVVMESLMLGGKPGYTVGGTVHVIINNQVGFTEPNPMTRWPPQTCTDVTRMVDAPVLRVNADDPEQALRAVAIALDWRERYQSDVVIDLIGYRRLGHSESDVPALTRPRIHAMTQRHATVADQYAARLKAENVAAGEDMDSHVARRRWKAHQAFSDPHLPPWQAQARRQVEDLEQPALSDVQLRQLVAAMTGLPDRFQPHVMVQTLVDHWQQVVRPGGTGMRADWALAESLAYATLLTSGVPVRISGMDVRRGTFLHRQAVWISQGEDHPPQEFVPLRQLGEGAARFDIFNSPLSEEAVLGFEYGYSVQNQAALTVWEAQFGDFVNGAQVFLDQYISSGEDKWGYRSALALLLPHGNEGVGPDHSSAYLSRFLQLCGGDNLRVAFPSTAAQWFHLLRHQGLSAHRKPLVVMSPKGTLYHQKASHAALDELVTGRFLPVLDDTQVERPAQVERLLLCSGKVFYDLDKARHAVVRADLAVLRLEQLYPFPAEAMAALLARYPATVELTWVQEEHRNQGAWSFVREQLEPLLPPRVKLRCVARPPSASGATSSYALHHEEQRALVERAIGESEP